MIRAAKSGIKCVGNSPRSARSRSTAREVEFHQHVLRGLFEINDSSIFSPASGKSCSSEPRTQP